MYIMTGKRGSGKTTNLIRKASEMNATIVAHTGKQAEEIEKLAKEIGVTIPKPISWDTFVKSHEEHKNRKGVRYMVDELGLCLNRMGIAVATFDENHVKNLNRDSADVPKVTSDWVRKEIELAIASEENSDESDAEKDYDIQCYKNAMDILEFLLSKKVRDDDSSIFYMKSIVNRLVEGKVLTPIEDTDDVWEDISEEGASYKEYQCKRMSGLFKRVREDGTIDFVDINRTQCYNVDRPNAPFVTNMASSLVDKLFPITMPYIPRDRKFKVYCDEFSVDKKDGKADTLGYFHIVTPMNKTVHINRFFKFDEEAGVYKPIDKEEYDERKKKSEESKESVADVAQSKDEES